MPQSTSIDYKLDARVKYVYGVIVICRIKSKVFIRCINFPFSVSSWIGPEESRLTLNKWLLWCRLAESEGVLGIVSNT